MNGSSFRTIMTTTENKELKDAVFTSFSQQQLIWNPLSDPIVCEKVKMFAGNINGLSEFKASNNWIYNF